MHEAPSLAFATLGCKTNQAETATWAAQLAGVCAVVDLDAGADVVVVNTCSVTHEAERQSRQLVRRARRANPRARIVVTGCAAERDPVTFAGLAGVEWVAPNAQKEAIAGAIASWYDQHAEDWAAGAPVTSGHTRAWLKISEGCNNRCSYCIVPALRGPERSVALAELVERARRLAALGYREIVLTGTNLARYGRDQGTGLAALLEALIAQVPGVPRWRIGSIEPIDFPVELREVLAHPAICPQLHLCLQSGSDAILAGMRRRYTASAFLELVRGLRAQRPDLALTTDVIVGFPGESEEDFARTLELVREVGFAGVHAFPFSRRAGTVAADDPRTVEPRVVAGRLTRLGEASAMARRAWEDGFVGTTLVVLSEGGAESPRLATSAHGLRVGLDATLSAPNELWRVMVGPRSAEGLEGTLIERLS